MRRTVPARSRHAGCVPEVITLDGRSLTAAQVMKIARDRAETQIAPEARERNAAAERLVRSLVDRGELLYGVTTGVGVLRSRPSARENRDDHQWRLIPSHAGGGGGPLTGVGRAPGEGGAGDHNSPGGGRGGGPP